MTPHEAHTGIKPDLSKLRVFGSRILCKVPGKRTSKLDHHIYKGIFIGYGAMDKHIRYIDSVTSREKTATHAIFDEAHYTSPTRPPGPQLLYSLGMPREIKEDNQKSDLTIYQQHKYPSLGKVKPNKHRKVIDTPLPLNEFSILNQISAKAAKVDFL